MLYSFCLFQAKNEGRWYDDATLDTSSVLSISKRFGCSKDLVHPLASPHLFGNPPRVLQSQRPVFQHGPDGDMVLNRREVLQMSTSVLQPLLQGIRTENDLEHFKDSLNSLV